jgi:hypothetical protein
MGQTQLLLIVVGLVVICIAVMVGFAMMNEHAGSANREAVTLDLVELASRAQEFYRRPTNLSGGGQSFAGLEPDLSGMQKLVTTAVYPMANANGTYRILTAGDATQVVLQGTGTETGKDGNNKVVVTMDVYLGRFSVRTTGGATVVN